MKSLVRAVLVSREAARQSLSGVRFYPGMGCTTTGIVPPMEFGHSFNIFSPCFSPCKRTTPPYTSFAAATWLLLGGDKCRSIGNCTAQIITAFMEFLRVAVRGSGVRFECAVSGDNSCAVLSLMATYGTRMTEFCLAELLLVCSTKYWSYYVNSLMLDTLSRLVDLGEGLQTANFHNRLLASVYDAGLMLRFLAFGKSRHLDHNRVCVLFPCRQLAPGSRQKSRQDDDGFAWYVPSLAENFNRLMPSIIFGHVPFGPFVRVILAEIFSSFTVELLCCPAEEAAEWWLTTAARLVNVECGMSAPASSATACSP
eukprot:XP_008178264.2 PREDICTED: uncharacterized protein LOC100570089 [Acyrthosiphon pisum]